jgi:hypothetical protein
MAQTGVVNKPKIQRPVGIWVITIFESLITVLVAMTLISIFKEKPAATVPIDMIDWALTVVNAGLGFCAAWLLFFLKKSAFKVFCASFIFLVMTTALHLLTKGLAGTGSLRSTLIGWTILAIVCKYVWDLKEKGVLS